MFSGGLLPLGTRTLPRVKHPEDLKSITTYSIGNKKGSIGHSPFARVFDSTSTTHTWELEQFVYASINRIGKVVSSLGIFKCNVASVVLLVLSSFPSH